MLIILQKMCENFNVHFLVPVRLHWSLKIHITLTFHDFFIK